MAKATRNVTRRDGRLEGEPDDEADAGDVDKEIQRDLTSLGSSGVPAQRS